MISGLTNWSGGKRFIVNAQPIPASARKSLIANDSFGKLKLMAPISPNKYVFSPITEFNFGAILPIKLKSS